MDLAKAQEGLTKAQAVLEKKEKLLAKYETKAQKQHDAITKRGWDPENRWCLPHNHPDYDECYWAICDYSSTIRSIKDTKSKIEDQKKVIAGWQDKVGKATAESNKYNDLPQLLLDVKKNIEERWNEFDFQRRQRLREAYDELGYKEFVRKHTYSAYRDMHQTDAEIRKDNERAAKNLVINLWTRVKEITGEVTDASDLHTTQANSFEGIALNGIVVGKDGKASVESILAGGYNIQKLHIRTLVHDISGQQVCRAVANTMEV